MSDGWTLAKEGMAQAADHADRVSPSWSDLAYECIVELCDLGEDFLVEDAIAIAARRGVPEPPTNRAWGAIIRRAASEGLVVNTGRYGHVKNPSGHRGPRSIWHPDVLS